MRGWLRRLSYTSSPDAATKRDLRLISGITIGIVYRGVIDREGLTSMLSRVMRRAGCRYRLTVSMTIVFSIVSMWLKTPPYNRTNRTLTHASNVGPGLP